MIYAAALLVIIYISIKLIPYLIGGILILQDEMENDPAAKTSSEKSIESRILSNYTSYRDFQDNFEDFLHLSKRAQKKIKQLFD